MDADTAARAFDPFFTTKVVGKGSGLGLSTVLGMVEQSGGSIDLRSQLGNGARVEIRFPRASGSAAMRATIDRAFKLKPRASSRPISREIIPASGLQLQHTTSIRDLDAIEWDSCLGSRGSFDSRALRTLERVLGEHQKPENRWSFQYYVVRDAAGRVLLATFFTDSLWKDDMLAPSAVSKAVEAQRASDPYHMTSHVYAMGCLLTEGDHLFLDRSGDWRGALACMLGAVDEHAGDARLVVLRDLPAADHELESELRELGFAAAAAPDSLIVDRDWSDEAEFLARLPREARRFQRRFMAPLAEAYQTEIFERALEDEGWEVFTLRLRPEHGGPSGGPPQVVGLDYAFAQSHRAYRVWMRESLRRAEARGAARIYFGLGSPIEKARFGARPAARNLYLHSRDHFASDALSLIAQDTLQRQVPERE
jgi:hypothetical protein